MANIAAATPATAVSMRSLENAFKKTLTIDEKTQGPTLKEAHVVDPNLAVHLHLPQYAGSFLSLAGQDVYKIFLQDLEDVNGGAEIPMAVAAAAWARFVGQKFKEWDANSICGAGKSPLLAKIRRQARPGVYTNYRRSKMSKEDLKTLVAKQTEKKTKHQGVLDGMAKFAKKARRQQRRELRLAKSMTSTSKKSMRSKKHKKLGHKTKKERLVDTRVAMALHHQSDTTAKKQKNNALAELNGGSSSGLEGNVSAPGGDIDMQM